MNLFVSVCLLVYSAAVSFAFEPGSFFSDGPAKNEIALTFDDGPGPSTEKILDILKRYEIKATFFMEGSQMDIRPAIARKVISEGNEVGSHLYSHPNFYYYKKQDFEKLMSEEIEKTEKTFEKTGFSRTNLIRMPHGYVKPWVKEIAKQKGYVLINWTFGCDWKKMPADELAEVYINKIRPGAIFLMHDGGKNRQALLEALPKIIEEIKKRGYKLVTVSELLELKSQK